MANIYVDNAGSNTSPYDTWAKAANTLAAAAAIDAAGDTIWVKNTHTESTAGALTLAWAGTTASPTRIICVSDTGEPPTTVATGASVATTGASNISPQSGANVVYFYGITFKAGNSTNIADINFAGRSWYDNCAFELNGDSVSSTFDAEANSATLFVNCSFKTTNAGGNFQFNSSGAKLTFSGGSWASGSASPTNVFNVINTGCALKCVGFDFTNLSSTSNLSNVTSVNGTSEFINCKLPASWSGALNNGTPGHGGASYLMNSDSADTNYRLEKNTIYGTVTHDTSIYVTAGASDGTTNISWKMVSNADAEWLESTLDSPEIVRWNETTGSSVTVTIEFLIDSATTLNNNDVWMEVTYLGTSGVPLGSFDIDSRCATYLTTPAECTTGTGTGNWTGEGGSAKSYKCTSTFTPQKKGLIKAVVKLAKASTTIYVDPKLYIS